MMNKIGLTEFGRRAGLVFLGVLGIVGSLTFMSALLGFLCLGVGIAFYLALPRPRVPSGAIRPKVGPSVLVLDFFAFVLSAGFLSAAIVGPILLPTRHATLSLVLLLPAIFSLAIFLAAIRQATSWMRFFGNGFEVMQYGHRTRVRYSDLASVSLRVWRLPSGASWLVGALGKMGAETVYSGARQSRTLVMRRRDGVSFAVSAEIIPDLERIMMDMDRAGLPLPEGLSHRGQMRIRLHRERLYGTRRPQPAPTPPSAQNSQRGAGRDRH